MLGEGDLLGLEEGLIVADADSEAEGLTDGLALADGDREGLALALGDTLASSPFSPTWKPST